MKIGSVLILDLSLLIFFSFPLTSKFKRKELFSNIIRSLLTNNKLFKLTFFLVIFKRINHISIKI